MWPYVICFIFSILFTYLAGNKKIVINKITISSKLLSLIAIIIPCFFAAVRDSTIGTDVLVYSDRLFNTALKYGSIIDYLNRVDVELLFGTVTFISSHFFNRVFYYFILQFLVIFPIYKFLFQENTKKYAWVGIMIYLFWLYPFSLNIMRQSISISIMLYNYKNIKEKKLIRYLFLCLIAFGFHFTALLGLLFYPLNKITTIKKAKKSLQNEMRKPVRLMKKINKLLIVLTVLFVTVIGSQIIEYFTSTSGLYTDQLLFKSSGNIEIMNALIMVFMIGIAYIYKSSEDENVNYLLFLIIIGSILYQLKSSFSQMYRFSAYFTNFLIFLYPMILNSQKNNRKRMMIIFFVLCISCINFSYYIIIRQWHSVFPYVFFNS